MQGRFLKEFSKIGSVAVIKPISAAVKMKYFSLYFGTMGIGLLSQGQLVLSLIYSFGSLGLGIAITKYLSDDKIGLAEQIQILGAVVRILLVSLIVQVGIFLALINPLSHYLFGDETHFTLLLILTCSIPFLILSRILEAILNSKLEFSHIARGQLISILLSLAAFLLVSRKFAEVGALIAVASYYVFLVMIYSLYVRRLHPELLSSIRIFGSNQSRYMRSIYKFGMANLFRSIVVYLSMVIMRGYIVSNYGIAEVGLYQAAYSISMYIVTGFQAISVYILPVISSLSDSRKEIEKEINVAYSNILLIIFPIVALTIIFHIPILKLLFTDEFVGSSLTLIVLVCAQVFNVVNILNTSTLLGMNKLRIFLTVDIGRYLGQFILFIFFFKTFGIIGIAYSALISQSLFYIFSQYGLHHYQIHLSRANYYTLLVLVLTVFSITSIFLFGGVENIYPVVSIMFIVGIIFIGPQRYYQMLSSASRPGVSKRQ